MTTTNHPRGTPTWPDWKQARPGQRVQSVRTGWTGTVVKVKTGRAGSSGFAVIQWDRSGSTGRVVAPAFDLRPV
jgi:hypothetical protein